MDLITHLQAQLIAVLPILVQEYEGEIAVESLSALEKAVQHLSQEVGQAVVTQVLEAQEPRYAPDEVCCPHCAQAAQYVRRREGTVMTLQGRLTYRRRYYVCPACGKGHYPLDARLAIQPGQMSQEVVQVAALLGINASFETSRDVLARTLGLDLSANSIRKACQVMGERVIAQEEQGYIDSQNLDRQREHRREGGPTRLYGSMDGFMVLFEDDWHEMKSGAWWTIDGQGQAHVAQYYVETASAEAFGDLVWTTGFAQHADQAKELVFITDGAEWIERLITHHFPHAVTIVDWFHAAQYLTPVAALAAPTPDKQADWLARARADLWEGRLDTVIQACQLCVRPRLKTEDDPAQIAVRYYTNQRHRLDYPTYRAQGYCIGSGVMESACKQLGLQRLKIAGARWGQDRQSARRVAKARAVYLSGHWDTLSACPAA
jgi:hypothetical protein